MASQADVSAQMIATLALTEPDLDTSIGSVTRKIIDAVAQSVADSYVDQHLLTYQYDIDSKIEADLDDFCQLFGISRLAAKRATGVVTFYRGTGDANRTLFIPVGTQVASTTTPSQYVQTVTGASMPTGVTSVDVPVQAVTAGPSGNVGSGLLTVIRTPLEGVPSCTNIDAMSGGVLAEGDSELRSRWKRTVFRSLAGTESMYAGIALDEPACTQVSVVGASKTYREQVQIIDGEAVSSIDDARYIYGASCVLGPNIDAGNIFTRTYDYTFNHQHRDGNGDLKPRVVMSPTKTVYLDTDANGEPIEAPVEGAVLDLSFEYAPEASRNLPNEGITNRVDVWCAGTSAREASQTVVFQTTLRFSPLSNSPYFYQRFVRQDESNPAINNVFIPLAYGPIITVPSVLSIDGSLYHLNDDFFIVHDDSAFGYAPNSLFGLEFDAERLPAGLAPVFDVGSNGDYIYNAVPRLVQDGIDRWRLTGIDAVAHQAKMIALRFALAVIFERNASQSVTTTQIEQAIATYLSRLSFNATIQASDVISAVHNVQGVDSVRFLELSDWPDGSTPNFVAVGIQQVVDGDVVASFVDPTTGQARDVTFGDSELPIFDNIVGDTLDTSGNSIIGRVSVRAQNTFYTRIGGG